FVATERIEIEPERFGQDQLRDAEIISRGDQLRDLIGKRDLGLEDVESRNGPGFETVLLILQLAFQQLDLLLLHADERFVEDNLIVLRLHRGDNLIDDVAEREVGAVALKEGATNRAKSAVVENQLRAGDADRIRNFGRTHFAAAASSSATSSSRGAAAKAAAAAEVRVGPLQIRS